MTIRFPDVSHYQQGLSLHGAPAVIAKATQGSSIRDAAYAGFRSQANSLGIPFVGYHWIDQSSTAAQAANAFAVIGHAPLMWDAEASGATVSRIVDLTNRLRAMGGNPRLVYLPHWWWQDHLGSPSLTPLAQAGLHLISSQYTTYSDTGPGWHSYGGMAPVIWQYTNTQSFNGQKVDFNAYNGTIDELRALMGLIEGDDDMALTDGDVEKVVDGVWGRVIASSSLDTTAPASDWLKQGMAARRVAEGLNHPAAISASDLAAAVKAALPAALQDPAVLAAVAKAVNDDHAARMAAR